MSRILVAAPGMMGLLLTGSLLALPSIAEADCTCVNKGGAKYELGERACLNVNGETYLAECEMNLNNTSWKRVSDSCPLSLNAPAHPNQSDWQHLALLAQ